VRFNLSSHITNTSLDVLEMIIEGIYAKEKKKDILQRTNLSIEKIRALLQICMNKKYISMGQYEHISAEINEAGKMLGGWIRSCKG